MLIVWFETEGDTSESYIAGTFEKSANSLPFEGQRVSSFGIPIFVWVLVNVVRLF